MVSKIPLSCTVAFQTSALSTRYFSINVEIPFVVIHSYTGKKVIVIIVKYYILLFYDIGLWICSHLGTALT